MPRPTLVSLARQTGVSRQTVSNVINAPELVHPETRARVERAIRESGYRPSVAARALRRQRATTIGMRLYRAGDGINGVIMDRFLHDLVECVEQRGYRVLLFTADSAENEARRLGELVESGAIDAAILTDTYRGDPRPELLRAAGTAFGSFGRPWSGDDQDPAEAGELWADIDGRVGTAAATRHLLGRGCTRIGFIGWPAGSGVGDDRLEGWRTEITSAGAAAGEVERWIVRAEDHPHHGAHAMAVLADRGVQAVVCASDSLALGALETLRRAPEHERWWGQELPIIGFDDTPVARAVGLPSVHQPVELAARHLADGLLGELAGREQPADRSALIAPELQIRTLATYADPAVAPMITRTVGPPSPHTTQ